MRSFWIDPFLWIHLAGLAALPVFLELCLVGFAVGDPLLPPWLELLLVAVIGAAPVVWMQWQRPFYIFSLVALALKPEQLTEPQRQLLTRFKSQRIRVLAAVVPVLLFLLLRQLYAISPLTAPVLPFSDDWRLFGLILAAIGFFGSNLFLQVPASVLAVMAVSESEFAATGAYPVDQIRQNFSLIGLPVNQILPPLVVAPKAELATVSTPVPDFPGDQVRAAVVAEATADFGSVPLSTVESGTVENDATLPVVPPPGVDGSPEEPTATKPDPDLEGDIW